MCSDPCVEKNKKREFDHTFNFLYMDKFPTHVCKNCENTKKVILIKLLVVYQEYPLVFLQLFLYKSFWHIS